MPPSDAVDLATDVSKAEAVEKEVEPIAVDIYGKLQEVIAFLHIHWPNHPTLPAPMPTPTLAAPVVLSNPNPNPAPLPIAGATSAS